MLLRFNFFTRLYDEKKFNREFSDSEVSGTDINGKLPIDIYAGF